MTNVDKNSTFSLNITIFCRRNPQNALNNIVSGCYEKNFETKFWSLGTALGYLGPVFQKALGLGFYQLQFLVIWGPYDLPILVAPQAHAKNPKSAGAWCGPQGGVSRPLGQPKM